MKKRTGTRRTSTVVALLLTLLMATTALAFAADDYGDAPASYGIAFQEANVLNMLGSCVDGEAASIHTNDALGDDNDTTPACADDGATFSTPIWANAGLTVNVSVDYVQNAHFDSFIAFWLDLNGDGDFEDAGEKIHESAAIFNVPGTRTYTFSYTVPADALPRNTDTGYCYGRLILSSDNERGPTGNEGGLKDGEVEDYAYACDVTAISMSNIGAEASSSTVVLAAAVVMGLFTLWVVRFRPITKK